MKALRKQTPGLFLLLVYAFFFASTNLFYHAHWIADTKIVHSHPAGDKAHSHTTGQINFLEITTNEVFDGVGTLTSCSPIPESGCSFEPMMAVPHVQSAHLLSFSLRAPPHGNDTLC